MGPGSDVECVVRVLVRQDIGARSPGPARETGSALLGPGARELEGYGLDSYLLLGAPPGAAVRERYVKSIEAFWTVMLDVRALEEYVPRSELNVAYVPVKAAPGASVTAEWILDNYDYARARSLLRHLPGAMRDGPYLVSALKPLAGGGGSQYLLQDLSSVPPHLAASWVKEFLNQAAQERFWDQRTGARLALKLRVTIGVLGEGLPEVQESPRRLDRLGPLERRQGPICFVGALGSTAQRTESTPRVLPSGAASQLDPSHRSSRSQALEDPGAFRALGRTSDADAVEPQRPRGSGLLWIVGREDEGDSESLPQEHCAGKVEGVETLDHRGHGQ